MAKLIIRILIGLCASIGFSKFGVKGDVNIMQTLFTILGIVFSIVMSLLVTFDLSEILNAKIRKRIRTSINETIHNFVADFIVAAFVFLLVAVIFKSIEPIEVHGFTIDLKLAGIIITIFSLGYEVYNFGKIHKLKIDIEEQVLTEKQNTPKQ